MTKNMKKMTLGTLVMVFGLVGCSAHKKEALNESVDRYLVALRRADFEYAAVWVPEKNRQEFLKNSLRFKDYTISNVELERMDTSKETEAEMIFLIEVYSINESEVKTFRRKILWNYDASRRSWEAMAKGPLGASLTN